MLSNVRWVKCFSLTGFLALLSFSVFFTGCASSEQSGEGEEAMVEAEQTPMVQETTPTSSEMYGDSDSSKAGELQTVYFDYDSSNLSSSTKMSLDANANFLKANTSVNVQIEGHCDERGGVQYNLALGERRANAVKSYLVSAGVDEARLSTISYGKERPKAFGHDESSWSQNRRANFAISSK